MAVTREEVTEIYIAYYDRAPDASGLDYWVSSGLSAGQIAQSFGQQEETKAKYPDTLTTQEYVTQIYLNVYNRAPDAEGLSYWTNQLNSGAVSKPDMIIAIVNGAIGDDQVVLNHKTVVGVAYADAGLDDVQDATTIMDDITTDPHTTVAALEQIDAWANVGDGVIFTTERDTLVGTSADETFKGTVSGTDSDNKDTYQGFDGLYGGDGTDTLQITSSVTTAAGRTIGAAKVSSVEILKVIQNASHDVTVDPTNFDSTMSKIVAESNSISTGNIIVGTGVVGGGSSLKNIVSAELGMSNHQTLSLNYADSIVVSKYNTMDVTLTNGVEQSLVVSGESTTDAIETYNVTAQDTAQKLTISDTANDTINVKGSGTLTLISATASTIDASASTGSLIFDATVGASTIKGAIGKDTITGIAGASIWGMGGADSITLKADETVYYATHNDSTQSKEDIINHFDSNANTIRVSDAVESSGYTSTGTAPVGFSVGSTTLTSGTAYTGPDGQTNVYLYENGTNYQAYIDVDQSGVFESANDLVIKLLDVQNGAPDAADFIV